MSVKKCVISNGGGLDSLAAHAWAAKKGYKIYSHYVLYSQLGIEAENRAALEIANYYKALWNDVIIDTDIWGVRPDTSKYMSMRNVVFLSMAVALAERENITTIITGFRKPVAGLTYKDATPKFARKMQELVSQVTDSNIKIISPFANNPWHVLFDCMDLKAPVEKAWWCPTNGPNRCGVCNKCQQIFTVLPKILAYKR